MLIKWNSPLAKSDWSKNDMAFTSAEGQTATKKALKKLEDRLTCAICLDSYKDPKLLQCFHVFCEKCLVPLVVQDRQGHLSVRCPTCRRSTLLPAASVSGLQSAFHIHHLFEIQEAFEKSGKEPPVTEHVDSSEQPLPPKKTTFLCPFHEGRELELYCETCDELLCFQCTLRLHTGHQYDMVSELFEKHKNEITASLEPVEKGLDSVNKAMEQLDLCSEQISDQRAAIEVNIHETFQHLHEALEIRRTELISELNLKTQQKMKNLAAQRDEIEIIQIQLKSCVEFVSESLRTGSQGEVMNMKKPVVTQIKKLTNNFKSDMLRPAELANMKFKADSFSLPIQQFGKVYLQKVLPEKCYISARATEMQVIEVNKEITAIVHAIDEDGEACQVPVESVSCELVCETTSLKTKGHTKQLGKGQYEVSYTPTTVGKHDLHITIQSSHIVGSPFPMIAITSLGTSTKPIYAGLKSPWGLAVNRRGEIIVADNERHCITVFSPSGEELIKFGSLGSSHGEFYHPRGLAVDDDDGIILVADYGNHRIQKFTNHGKFLKAVGKKGSASLQFNSPIGIAIHPHNKKIYVVEQQNHRIQILNRDLTFSNSFGHMGYANGKFHLPRDVAFDKTGNVYVADSAKHCVQVFTSEGRFLMMFECLDQYGTLRFPTSIAIIDNIICITSDLTDTVHRHQVLVFSVNGWLMTSFGEMGTGKGELNGPQGIAVNEKRMIYVNDTCNRRVTVYNNMV